METPRNNAGRLTELIMAAVMRGWEPQGKVPVSNYNRIYGQVYDILHAEEPATAMQELNESMAYSMNRSERRAAKKAGKSFH